MSRSLDDHPEPSRYVILRHEPTPLEHAGIGASTQRPLHWDVMFDVGETLRTWAFSTEPWEASQRGASSCSATQLADHRRAYLDYEGPVSGNRGTVVRVDSGTYRVRQDSPEIFLAELSSSRGMLRVRLTRSGAVNEQSEAEWLPEVTRAD